MSTRSQRLSGSVMARMPSAFFLSIALRSVFLAVMTMEGFTAWAG